MPAGLMDADMATRKLALSELKSCMEILKARLPVLQKREADDARRRQEDLAFMGIGGVGGLV
ncbi:hypothetical protein ACJ73_00055 [Blastomyces percursus]|uniref:Uncharacterized protein n=1 Tax=Blastomyces percursus TaxID=1658174 RepID=A0A1J9QJ77_9EURO|nr:hypothetical protein ACJ73_00055 [Blastomyces percursus]